MDINVLGEAICGFCILLMRHMVEMFGMGYGLINVLLFIIFGPLSTLAYAGCAICQYFNGPKWLSNTLFWGGTLMVLIVCGMVFAAFIDM